MSPQESSAFCMTIHLFTSKVGSIFQRCVIPMWHCQAHPRQNFHVHTASVRNKPTAYSVTRLLSRSVFHGPASHTIHFRHCFQIRMLGDKLLPPRPPGSPRPHAPMLRQSAWWPWSTLESYPCSNHTGKGQGATSHKPLIQPKWTLNSIST